MKIKFGIIGFGRFGQLWAKALLPFGSVWVYDKNTSEKISDSAIKVSNLEEVLKNAEILFLLVPISEFELSCRQIKDLVQPNTLIVDCCSVKVHPVNIMQKIFNPSQPLLGTHPLFGPDSVKRTGGLQKHKIVLCPVRVSEQQLEILTQIFEKMGLNMLRTTPEDHDREMANSQGLVHFIGRGLAALDLKPQEISTPDFQALLNINQMVVNDTWRLFLDMHQYNPYTRQIRQRFIHQLTKLEEAISHGRD
ncbi:MAG: prephenate dehydrogenase/arogenate dehydrogenase family protein [Proteobacteria bacterium]|nr:prephenate dehydrogenase/arogenate dehydrogenase family protein [Pseudomonadota bacterium]